jgi:Protein of unknown function (DUF3800)
VASPEEVLDLCRAALSGKDGFVVVLKAHLDESGIHDNSHVVTVGAYLAKPKMWRHWIKEWNQAKRPIRIFHSADCANLHGEFKGWSESERDALVAKALPTIADAHLAGFVIGISLDDFNNALASRADLRGLFGTPYTACFQWIIQSIINRAIEFGNTERIAFFHENNDYHAEAFEAFDWVKKHRNPGERGVTLTFGAKEDFPPLQAADVLAYEGNKRLRDLSRPCRRAWTALKPAKNIRYLYYDRENIPTIIPILEDMRADRAGLKVVRFDSSTDQAESLS